MNSQRLLHIILIYLAVINVVTFFMYGVDKWKAKKFKYGVPAIIIVQLILIGYFLYEQ